MAGLGFDTILKEKDYTKVIAYIEACTHEEQLMWLCLKIKEKLRSMGYNDPMYCKPNVEVRLLEFGSSGVHVGYKMKETNSFWIIDGDLWPSDPVMYKEMTEEEIKEFEARGRRNTLFIPPLGANEGG